MFTLLLKAPDSMKAVVQAAWLLTVAFGNIIVIVGRSRLTIIETKDCGFFHNNRYQGLRVLS